MFIIKRILRRVDYLAPSIGLYYNGSSTHYSKASELISLISGLITVLSIIYYIRPFIKKKNPSVVMNEKFLYDAGTLPINPSNIVHSLSLTKKNRYNYDPFDFTAFTVIGLEDENNIVQFGQYSEDILDYNHWVYGLCDANIDYKSLDDIMENYEFEDMYLDIDEENRLTMTKEKIKEIFKSIINTHACIKKYYDRSQGKYFDVNERNFKWPSIKHGYLNQNGSPYRIIVQSCNQEILELIKGKNYYCKNEEELANYINNGLIIELNFVDNYIDLDNYDEPVKSFIDEYSFEVSNDFYYSNTLYFSPLEVKTTKGVLINHSSNKKLYDLTDNEETIHPKINSSSLYSSFIFELDNIQKKYQRKYINLIDVFSRIGGLSRIIKFIAKLIIKYYNQYIVLYDTKRLISSLYIDEEEKEKYKLVKRNITLNKNIEMTDINKDNSYEKIKTNNNNNIISNFNNNILDDNTINANNVVNNINNTTNNINNINNNHTYNNTNINNIINDIDNNLPPPDNQENINESLKNMSQKAENKVENNIEEESVFTEENKKMSYCSYVCFKLSCKKKYQHYKIYDKFRTKILSEEEIIKNYIITYNLYKANKSLINNKIYSVKEILEKQ